MNGKYNIKSIQRLQSEKIIHNIKKCLKNQKKIIKPKYEAAILLLELMKYAKNSNNNHSRRHDF